MWAMIPMLRVLASENWRVGAASAMVCHFFFGGWNATGGKKEAKEAKSCEGELDATPGPQPLPAVVGEGLVGLSHLVHVLTPLYRSTNTVGGIQYFVGQPLGHGLFATLAGAPRQPPDGPGASPAGPPLPPPPL